MRTRLIITAATVLGACSGESAGTTSEANFEAVLDSYYAANSECVRTGKAADSDGIVGELKLATINQGPEAGRLDALVDAGLLTAEEGVVETLGLRGEMIGTDPVRRYVLTEVGRDALRPAGRERSYRRSASEFCYGHREVTEVTSLTEPAEALGVRTTSVAYAYELTDVPGWARSGLVAKAFPQVAEQTTGSQRDTDDLVLTNDGWVHHREAP